eukprot:GHVN01010775.1.p2 GENE.GHVN01010775.1~~GHVN01010775.1.p2  ORF type:complete len:447 (-),score=89.01 GHVN01010775.1:2332-3561(-)
MAHQFVVGCVGKPSAGKSTFFNAVTEKSSAKVGNYPFTTIDPNIGITYFTTQCPCKRYNVVCKPRYGSCDSGTRRVPLKLLDVAGLIPGAAEGRGLGNKFLDDLRHADVLIHVLDVSGQTNEKGEVTLGYDPSKDHEWLVTEIELWIFNNLWDRWLNIARRHTATNSTFGSTFLSQLSGYGARERLIEGVGCELGVTEPCVLGDWDKTDVERLVKTFVKHRFPFVLLLNKADQDGETDKNAMKICEAYGNANVVICSALAECFLRKLRAQKYIDYTDGSMTFTSLKESTDDKLTHRLDKIKDMVLYRYGSTGVQKAINAAVDLGSLIPVYPVKSFKTFGNDKAGSPAFPECLLVKKGTTVRQLAKILHDEIDRNYVGAEGVNGCRMAEDEVITENNNVIRFITNKNDDG